MADNSRNSNNNPPSGTSRTQKAAALMASGGATTNKRSSTTRSSSNGKLGSRRSSHKSSSLLLSSNNSSNNSSSSGYRKKKSPAPIRALQEAVEDMEPFLARHPDAERAWHHLNQAVMRMDKYVQQLQQQIQQQQQQQQQQQTLKVVRTLYTDDPVPDPEPFGESSDPLVTLYKGTYEANAPSEDRSTVVIGDTWLFAGVWDGHGGTHAAEFCQKTLFENVLEGIRQAQPPSTPSSNGAAATAHKQVTAALAAAFTQTDRDYFQYAREINHPAVFFAGTCAIACHVDLSAKQLVCANLGDSRAVMGQYDGNNNKLKTIALSVDHSADNLMEQTRIRAEHPDDDDVLVDMGDHADDPDWRVKRIAAFTRSIGDLHLKEKNTSALFNSYVPPEQRILPRPGLKSKKTGITKPKYISTEPELQTVAIPERGFVIIACDGVWDEMTSEEAVQCVAWLLDKYSNQDQYHDIAALFIEQVLKRAVRRIAETYEEEEHLTLAELKARPCGKAHESHRALLHDDITVVIIQFGEHKPVKQYGGSLFNMLQNDAQPPSAHPNDEERSKMSRTKNKREMAVRTSIMDFWTDQIDQLQADAERQAVDRQILQMMNAFEDMSAQALKTLFVALDIDGNGTLDREEIARLIDQVMGMGHVSPEVLDLAFSEMDADGSGDVDFDEFIQFFGH
uniref:protein-serine/threonine phosphatase n=1 Tax=Amphora coffeiformis TaxID=265554 RepID=A0A7S3KYU2_9STRA